MGYNLLYFDKHRKLPNIHLLLALSVRSVFTYCLELIR
jgi:hypothetical protein